MSGSTSRRAFLGTGLALLAGLGGAAACAGTPRQRAAPLPAPVATDGYLSDPGHSPGRTVRRTRNGSTTTGTEPAPTFETLVAFLDTHLGRLPSPP